MNIAYWKPSYPLGLLLLFLLAGCSTPVTQYYVLNTISPPQQSSEVQVSAGIKNIAIRQLEIPRYLDRPRIVSRDADNHLRISEYHQWGGRLRDDLTRTLSDDLSERLVPIVVHTAPFPGSMHADVSLLIDVRQFELLADGRIHLKVRWHVQRAGEDSQSHFDHIISTAHVGERDYAVMAATMSRLLAQLSEKIAVAVIMPAPVKEAD